MSMIQASRILSGIVAVVALCVIAGCSETGRENRSDGTRSEAPPSTGDGAPGVSVSPDELRRKADEIIFHVGGSRFLNAIGTGLVQDDDGRGWTVSYGQANPVPRVSVDFSSVGEFQAYLRHITPGEAILCHFMGRQMPPSEACARMRTVLEAVGMADTGSYSCSGEGLPPRTSSHGMMEWRGWGSMSGMYAYGKTSDHTSPVIVDLSMARNSGIIVYLSDRRTLGR